VVVGLGDLDVHPRGGQPASPYVLDAQVDRLGCDRVDR
jgi:hypothetical protein